MAAIEELKQQVNDDLDALVGLMLSGDGIHDIDGLKEKLEEIEQTEQTTVAEQVTQMQDQQTLET